VFFLLLLLIGIVRVCGTCVVVAVIGKMWKWRGEWLGGCFML
jgi:hypothetical protein